MLAMMAIMHGHKIIELELSLSPFCMISIQVYADYISYHRSGLI